MKHLGMLLLGALVFGFGAPALISAPSYELVAAGFLAIGGYLWLIYRFYIKPIKEKVDAETISVGDSGADGAYTRPRGMQQGSSGSRRD